MKPVPIPDARRLGQNAGARGLVIVYVGDDGSYGATSWGRTMLECRALGRLLDDGGCDDLASRMDRAMAGVSSLRTSQGKAR